VILLVILKKGREDMVEQSKNKKVSENKKLVDKANEEISNIKEEATKVANETKTEMHNLTDNLADRAKTGMQDFKELSNKFINLLPDYLRTRFLSAIILIPIAILVIYSSKMLFGIFIIAAAVLMAFEWITITSSRNEEKRKWQILGLIYILAPTGSLVYIRNSPNGADVVLWLLLVVWATDIAGLIVGKTVEGPKLAPTISPYKTWSGLIGGVLASMFVGLLSSVIFQETASFFIVLSGMLAVVEQTSDLLESKLKRTFGVKDSGNLIPGHGGIMDRVDGLTLTAPLVALIVAFSKRVF